MQIEISEMKKKFWARCNERARGFDDEYCDDNNAMAKEW